MLTSDQRRQIILEYGDGATVTDLAWRHQVSRATILGIVRSAAAADSR